MNTPLDLWHEIEAERKKRACMLANLHIHNPLQLVAGAGIERDEYQLAGPPEPESQLR
jgi:hypothetical protein